METTIINPDQQIRPTGVPIDENETNPAEMAFKSGGTVYISDFNKANKPRIKRRIVRN